MPHNMTMVELLLHLDCQGCERTIRKALSKLKGVRTVDVDFKQQKVTAHGYIDQMKVLRRVRKAGKAAELWNPTQLQEYEMNYVYTPLAFCRTYNYYKHGFNTSIKTYHGNPYETTFSTIHSFNGSDSEEENGSHIAIPTAFMFSDDYPNACSIM